MAIKGRAALAAILLSALVMSGCSSSNSTTTTQSGNTSAAASNPPTQPSNSGGPVPSTTGVEKEKPAPGKGNVQGKAFYNEQPAVGVDVKLCEKFNQYFGGCSGETFTTKTDSNGEYLIKNVTPREYEGLIVYVFNTGSFIFATSGIVQAAKYNIEPDKTYFAPDTHLFKGDLKLLSPKAGAKLGASNIEVKWDAYPDAAYYKFSVFADTNTGAQPEYDFINKRIDGLSFVLDKPLTPGAYRVEVSAFNGNNVKLAESPEDIEFTVTGGASQ